MLPTRHGLLFTLVLFVIFLASVNYNNGLAYGLTFLLGSVALISMLHTHRNVSALEIRALSCEPAFAGELAYFRISVTNHRDHARYSIWLCCGDHRQVFHLQPSASKVLEVPVETHDRGYLPCPPLRLTSSFPLGLQYTWSAPIKSSVKGVVYPKPSGDQPLSRQNVCSNFVEYGHTAEGDDFAGLRSYAPGDSPRHIHWKALASRQELLTKQFAGEGVEQLWLRWQDTVGAEETRLSQLCQWVIIAERENLRYGLDMPGTKRPPDRGERHQGECLRLLALWGLNAD